MGGDGPLPVATGAKWQDGQAAHARNARNGIRLLIADRSGLPRRSQGRESGGECSERDAGKRDARLRCRGDRYVDKPCRVQMCRSERRIE